MSSRFGPSGSRENLAAKNSSKDREDLFLRFVPAVVVDLLFVAVVVTSVAFSSVGTSGVVVVLPLLDVVVVGIAIVVLVSSIKLVVVVVGLVGVVIGAIVRDSVSVLATYCK